MRTYELVMIFRPEMVETEVRSEISQVEKALVERGAEIKQVDFWGKRRLAYEIKGKRDGIYILAELRANPAAIAELDNQLKVSEAVLRHLVVRLGDD